MRRIPAWSGWLLAVALMGVFLVAFAVGVVALVAGFAGSDDTSAAGRDPGELVVHYIDVGQGDATLLDGPGFAILIDAGRHTANDVVPYLESVGITELDLLIGTHPHADHIGQFPQVLGNFEVAEVWLSGDIHTTRTFEAAVDAITASSAGYHEPRAGETFSFGSATVEVINPPAITGDFHQGSISVRIVYGDVAFIFTGDAEAETEEAMIERGHNLRAQLLKLGHHGSNTSSSQAFLDAVQPEVVIYSAADGNAYGHPHDEVIERLEAMAVPVYGTDLHGTIIVTTDGETYAVDSEHEATVRQ